MRHSSVPTGRGRAAVAVGSSGSRGRARSHHGARQGLGTDPRYPEEPSDGLSCCGRDGGGAAAPARHGRWTSAVDAVCRARVMYGPSQVTVRSPGVLRRCWAPRRALHCHEKSVRGGRNAGLSQTITDALW